MSDAFAPIAKAYDLLLDEQRLAHELPAIKALLGDARRICDLGCGNGDHLAALFQDGYTGCGIDAEINMVKQASERHPDIDIRLGDLANPPCQDWQAIICLGNVLACIESHDLPAVFTAWRAALAPGGRAIIQLVNPLRHVNESTITKRDDSRILIKHISAITGGALLSLLLHENSGGTWLSHASHQHLHHHHPDELQATCLRAGFNQVASYGALDGRPYSDDAPNLVLVGSLAKE